VTDVQRDADHQPTSSAMPPPRSSTWR